MHQPEAFKPKNIKGKKPKIKGKRTRKRVDLNSTMKTQMERALKIQTCSKIYFVGHSIRTDMPTDFVKLVVNQKSLFSDLITLANRKRNKTKRLPFCVVFSLQNL